MNPETNPEIRMNTAEKKQPGAKKPKKKKPLRRAQRWWAQVPGMALRMLGLLAVVIVLGLMFIALQSLGTFLRVAITAVLAIFFLILCFADGLNKGEGDAAASRSFEHALKKRELTAKEDALCYHPLKGICAALAVFIVPLALAVYIAATAKDYTYALQDLPLWLENTYGARTDVMAPLGAYTAEAAVSMRDYIRVVVRLPIAIYLNFFGDLQRSVGLADRLSPLMMATYPAAYIAGYLFGPAANRKKEKLNRRAKKVAVRKASRKSSLAAELTGEQNRVHYGHRPQEEKSKKKELI